MNNDDRVKTSPVRDAYFRICDEDETITDLINSCTSNDVGVSGDEPTVISLQDTVDLITKKYGENWRCYPECKMTVIWASRLFEIQHVKEIVPDLYDFCLEYREKSTVNGNKLPDDFFVLAFSVVS